MNRYTKLGYAGNNEPLFILPSTIATKDVMLSGKSVGGKIDDLDFFIGDEALSPAAANHFVKYPIRHGLVEDWDLMERFWYTFYENQNISVSVCLIGIFWSIKIY